MAQGRATSTVYTNQFQHAFQEVQYSVRGQVRQSKGKMQPSILLILDMINDFTGSTTPGDSRTLEEHPFAAVHAEVRRRQLISRTAEVIAQARASSVHIGYVRVGFSPDYRECSLQSPMFSKVPGTGLLRLGSSGTDVCPELAPADGDFDIVKHRVSPFYGTTLEPVLHTHGIRRMYVCGVSTSGSVQSAIKEGHDRDYECVLIEDCCAAGSGEEHKWAVDGMSRYCRVDQAGEMTFT